MSDEPELRPGPPWAMEDMIMAEAGLVAPVLANPQAAEVAALVRRAVAAGEPVVLTGCGTSEHAAQAGAELLQEALGARTVVARDAFEASLDPQRGGVVIGVSHEAGTAATLAAMNAATAEGARAVLVTACPDRAPAGPLVVATPLRDRAWCHTVGYLSPVLAFHAMAGPAPEAAARAVTAGIARRPRFAEDAARIAACERLLVVGSGADEITARELALKVEEGAHVPVTPLGMEKVLHGHLPAADARTGLVLLRFDTRNGDARDARARNVAAAAAVLDMPTVTLGGEADGLAPAAALQLLTLELAGVLGTNPDLIRREEPAYRAAAEAAGAG
jgi:glucosamine--fructose-6-phosphate aminotransferase (isomerizing)